MIKSQEMVRFCDSCNKFAFDLYDMIAEGNEGNVFFSPYSVYSALGVALGGAGGTTAEEMCRAMHVTDSADMVAEGYGQFLKSLPSEISVANGVFSQTGLRTKDRFTSLASSFRADSHCLDFKGSPDPSRRAINAWINDRTAGKIEELFPKGSVDSMTRLVIANAVYFKGLWKQQFSRKMTQTRSFRLSPGKTVPVPFMRQQGKFEYARREDKDGGELGYASVRLPYGAGIGMTILLPDNMQRFEDKTVSTHGRWLLAGQENEVNVEIPKFKLEPDTVALKDVLNDMGVIAMFDCDEADFSEIFDDEIYVHQILHKAVVEVDEKGTEAAAATGMQFRCECAAPPVPKFVADRPFVFTIDDDDTGTVLFMGRVSDPR